MLWEHREGVHQSTRRQNTRKGILAELSANAGTKERVEDSQWKEELQTEWQYKGTEMRDNWQQCSWRAELQLASEKT